VEGFSYIFKSRKCVVLNLFGVEKIYQISLFYSNINPKRILSACLISALNGEIPLPKYGQAACDPVSMATSILPCLPSAIEVLYDDFSKNCM